MRALHRLQRSSWPGLTRPPSARVARRKIEPPRAPSRSAHSQSLGVLGGSILLLQRLRAAHWVAGSSPAMTTLIAAGMLFASPPAHAATCAATIGTIAPVPTVSYDPFEGVSKSVTFTVDLKNTGSEICSLSLAIASSTTGSNRYFKKGSD